MSFVYRCKSYARIPFDESSILAPSFGADGHPLTLKESTQARANIIESIKQQNPDGMISSYQVFYIEAESYTNAFVKSVDLLEDRFGQDNYDIDNLKILKDKNGNEIELISACSCEYCSYEKASPDLKMEFICPNPKCKKEIKVADNGWESINCRWCNAEINRQDVKMGSDGNYYIEKKSKSKKNNDNNGNNKNVNKNNNDEGV